MANNYTYYGSATTSASGNTTIFTFRYNYLTVTNGSGGVLYMTTDGKTVPSAAGGDGIFEIPASTTVTIPNQQPLWFQSQSVIAKGTEVYPNTVSTSTNATSPAIVSPYGSSLAGGASDPGTVINFIGSAATTFVVQAAG